MRGQEGREGREGQGGKREGGKGGVEWRALRQCTYALWPSVACLDAAGTAPARPLTPEPGWPLR